MAKKQSLFECQHCGYSTTKWLGKCPECGSWESLIELNDTQKAILKSLDSPAKSAQKPLAITEVQAQQHTFFSSFQQEFDLVLGGGIVPGGLYLIGGSPGVGKSTLLLKVAGSLAKAGKKTLYVSGEESAGQIRLRAERLDSMDSRLFLLNEINIDDIKAALYSDSYEICIIDSIQTLYAPEVSSAPGSVSQVREITFTLMRLAKERNIAIFIIGHITKEGAIAGPRVLEHMVDCVLYFEGDPSKELRILRGFKNRFGTTSEIGIFEMSAQGLNSAKNASKMFFQKRESVSGSAVSVVLEGSRALVIEIQALVSESYGNPRRQSTGFESNRLNMLLALLERKLELPLGRYDVFVNVVGGIKINEPGADLAVIASIISSFRNRPLNASTAFIGEVSLVGDIREVSNIDMRVKELQSYGFDKVILAKKPTAKTSGNIKYFEANEVSKILEWM
ncbi:DNA repair protein RadA [Helicobacter sp. CLO-3]|uniref:DNA repair protein RadA n=1 Tax=unclassified Helicobacter TaxID=2593540 RepID=UPI0008057BC7|nr:MULTISPECIES: DNA repair protein RadA [unclassified Helicobacter]OBV29025.1 DNA repair protein RadA [Helicobacter sp. CLO-3]OHU81713.1 DNA repair protein RadA [Helicobacter sp. CLO-3]